MRASSTAFTCPLCAQPHTPVRLRRGHRALCTRCGTTLARPALLGPASGIAFAVTGLVLLVPAVLLPFATVSRIGPPRPTVVLDGAKALWEHDMPWLAGWVALCGTLVPAVLLVSLVVACWAAWRGQSGAFAQAMHSVTQALEAWAMPEVYVLAVMVAFVRVESVADVDLGPGFWCYAAMSVALVLAWRSLILEPHPRRMAA